MDTWTLFGRDRARTELMSLVTTLLLGLLLAWQHGLNDRESDALISTGVLGVLWCILVTIMAARERCSELALALPLPGRRIWKHHVAATMAVSVIHVVALFLPVTVTGNPHLHEQCLTVGGHLLAGLILLGSLIHRIRPGQSRLTISALDTQSVFAGLAALYLLIQQRSHWLSLAAVVLAGLLLLQAARIVRDGLSLIDRRTEPRGGYASLGRWDPTPGDAARTGPILLRAPARTGRHLSTLWMLGAMSLKRFSNMFQGVGSVTLIFLGGALATPGADLRMVIISLLGVLVIISVLSPELIRSGSPYAHLPIPRRRLHTALLLPVLAAVGFGAVLQVVIGLSTGTEPWLIKAVEWKEKSKPAYYTIMVPPRYYRIARDGQPPEIVSSTGETHIPSPLIWKSEENYLNGPVLYNPYEVGHLSSRAFAVEQYIRAVKDIYGIELQREQAGQLISHHNGRLDTADGLSIWRTPHRIAMGILIFSAIWMLLSTLFALLARLVHPDRVELWRSMIRTPAFITSTLVLLASILVLRITVQPALWFHHYLEVETTRLSRLMPGAFVSFTIALTCLAGAWLLSQELFARRECRR